MSGDVSAETPAAVDPDAVEHLGDEIARLAAHIHAAMHHLLVLLAEFDRVGGWEAGGHRSCAYWLAFRTGLDLGTAREHVRVARALEQLPGISAAMGRGELSFSKVRALTRVAESANEADLLELAVGCTAAQLERMVRAWKKGTRKEEAERERELYRSRRLSVFPDDDGMYLVQARIMAEEGASLMRAIEEAGDELYRKRRRKGSADEEAAEAADGADDADGTDAAAGAWQVGPAEAARRRADALGLLVEWALVARRGWRRSGQPGRGERAGAEAAKAGAEAEPESADGDEPRCACGRPLPAPIREVPISGSRAERYQVVLHVEPATLSATGEPGRCELEDGTRVSAETARRLSCDAGMIPVTHAPDGSVLDVGRKRRTLPTAIRRALEVRDRGCRFPGCGRRFTDGHHVKHWTDGGKTSLANGLLLCASHHTLVHEGGWRVERWAEGRVIFRDRRGGMHYDGGWKPPELSKDAVAELARENRRRGIDPDYRTAGARWKREADIPAAAFFKATEGGL